MSKEQILVTGSHGVIGTRLCQTLRRAGHHVKLMDLRIGGMNSGSQDIRDRNTVAGAMLNCTGIIHLAAISRVAWAESDPFTCWATNVDGTKYLVEAALDAPQRPWVVIVSSREVYGQPEVFPVSEDSPLSPRNHYGRSKLEAENLGWAAREAGLSVAVVRLANVYGSVNDHRDRVAPALLRRAMEGLPLMVSGGHRKFDFVHIDDTVAGLMAVVSAISSGERYLPPIHLTTGVPTSLKQLGIWANRLGGNRSALRFKSADSHEIDSFWGDPRRAADVLGWKAQVGVESGLGRLAKATRRHQLNEETSLWEAV